MTPYEKYRDAKSKIGVNRLVKNRFGRGLRVISKYDTDPWVEAVNNSVIIRRANSILEVISIDDLNKVINFGFAYNKDGDKFVFDTRRM